MTILFTNNASTSLASSITSGATSLTVVTGQGSLFPTITGSNIFYLTLQNQSGTTPIEIVKVTARSGDTMTIVRAQDGTTASAFNAGDKVELRLPAVVLQDFPQLDVTNTFTVDQSISGLTVGKGGGSVASNTAVGVSTLNANTTGAGNTVIGRIALYSNTTGNYNTALGSGVAAVSYAALENNTTGASNIAVGTGALGQNTTASNNTAVGYQAAYSNTTGNLTGIGQKAGYSNTTGVSNTAVGGSYNLYSALYFNTVGNYNTAVGEGALSYTTTNNCTAIGFGAGYTNTTGGITALGYKSLYFNTTGTSNTAVGGSYNTEAPLQANTTGSYNTALGEGSLAKNTTASYNTAVGYQSLYSNTTGRNTAFGNASLYANTTGTSNTAIGDNALNAATTANNNTAIGYISMANAAVTGSDNTAVGYGSLLNITSGASNVAIGLRALNNNTTASNNTAVGYQAGYTNSTGGSNVFMGYQAGYNATNNNTTAIGYLALNALTSGYQNTAVGSNAGVAATGDNGTFIGQSAGYYVTTGRNNTILGRYNGNQGGLDIRTASNYIVLSDGDGNPRAYSDNNGIWTVGNTINAGSTTATVGLGVWANYGSRIVDFARYNDDGAIVGFKRAGTVVGTISVTGSATAYNTSSDYRLKEDIAPMTGALAKVSALKPVTYKWKADGSDGEGFIAHELAEVCPQAVTGKKDGIDKDGNPDYQAIDVSFLVATLTAAIQELKAEFDAYRASHP